MPFPQFWWWKMWEWKLRHLLNISFLFALHMHTQQVELTVAFSFHHTHAGALIYSCGLLPVSTCPSFDFSSCLGVFIQFFCAALLSGKPYAYSFRQQFICYSLVSHFMNLRLYARSWAVLSPIWLLIIYLEPSFVAIGGYQCCSGWTVSNLHVPQ